jgi:hypothetical protein
MTRSREIFDRDGILGAMLAASDEDRRALRRARRPRRLPPVELASWLAVVGRADAAALRARPHTTGEPFTL